MSATTIPFAPSLPAGIAHRTGEWRLPALVLGGAALAWTTFLAATHIRLEDAFVTYRYASNLANGTGFVYNAGERVLGTTAPLHAMLLAAIGRLTGTALIPAASTVLAMLAALGAGAMTYRATRQLGVAPPAALLILVTYCVQPTTLWMATGGLETPLVLCLMATSLYGLAAREHHLAAATAALLPIMRIDAVIWSALTWLLIVARDRRKAVGPLTLAAAVLGPWLLFASLYFGSVIPHTVVAKDVIRFAGAFSWIDQATWLTSGWLSFSAAGLPGAIVGVGLMTIGAAALHRLSPSSLVVPFLVSYQLLFGASFLLGRAPHFAWYLIPLSWPALVLCMTGVWSVMTWLSSVGLRPLAAAGLLAYAALLVHRDWQTTTVWAARQENEQMRQQVGDWLHTQTPAGSSVAMEAIGYQGFYSERRVIDLAGLVSPAVVAMHEASSTNGEAFARIVSELQPDYIVLRSFEVDRNQDFHGGALFDTDAHRQAFASQYVEAQRFSASHADIWGDLSRVTIYARTAAGR